MGKYFCNRNRTVGQWTQNLFTWTLHQSLLITLVTHQQTKKDLTKSILYLKQPFALSHLFLTLSAWQSLLFKIYWFSPAIIYWWDLIRINKPEESTCFENSLENNLEAYFSVFHLNQTIIFYLNSSHLPWAELFLESTCQHWILSHSFRLTLSLMTPQIQYSMNL